MAALSNLAVPKESDYSLTDVTNNSTPNLRHSQSIDSISGQILSLTTIATSLQKEMAQLSRRSKDNATDLISLKEATSSRDEDIRNSLRDLTTNLSSKFVESEKDHHASRSASSFGHRPGSFLLDSKPHNFDGGLPKSFSQPRLGSPGFNSSELSSSTYSTEGPASLALLEKIFRDMSTKDGQEALSKTLEGLRSEASGRKADSSVLKKLEEIMMHLKDEAGSKALVHLRDGNPRVDNVNQWTGSASRQVPQSNTSRDLATQREAPRAGISHKAAEFVNEDLQKLLKKMKDSITEGGGLTAEVKAHLRELRGEVLGMGRDIARRLDQAESTTKSSQSDASGPGREEIAQIVQDGLSELKQHMEDTVRERRRQSSSSIASKHSIDSQEVFNAVRNALVEIPQQQLAIREPGPGIDRDDILDAVREAWETYKPEIELQNFGLERDEILHCLKEGLQQYQPQQRNEDYGGASYEEVLEAVRQGLQDFKPPAVESESSITREEILMTVQECLESFEFPVPQIESNREPELTREDVLDVVKEGLSAQAPISKEFEFNRDDLFDAVKAGLQGTRTPMGGVGEQVLEKMEELIDGMRIEFKQYSEANGGDTEQILDAMKDGLEVLRSDIETYVDKAQDVTGKDEILESMRHGLAQLRADLDESIATSKTAPAQSSNVEMLDAMEKEFDHLRQTISTSMIKAEAQGPDKDEILDVIKEGLESVKSTSSKEEGGNDNEETLNLMRDEFEHLRQTLATVLIRGGSSADKDDILDAIRDGYESMRAEAALRRERPESVLSNTSELLDAFNEGLETLRGDMEKVVNRPLDMTVNYEILETLKDGLASVRTDLDRLQRPQSSGRSTMRDGEVVIADPEVENAYKNESGKFEMVITQLAQLQIKVEALDQMQSPPTTNDTVSKEHFSQLEEMMRKVQASVVSIKEREQAQTITKEDVEAFETLLRNTKAKVEDFGSSDADGLARVTHFESLESILNETRDSIADLESDVASKKDIDVLEALLKEVRAAVDDVREKGSGSDDFEKVSKTDIEALESICMDTKTQIAELALPDPDTLPSKDEINDLGELVRKLDEEAKDQQELTAQAFEARKVEHGGLADRIEDVKLIFEDVREELKARIQDGHTSIRDLGKTLDTVAETVMAADTSATVNELRDTIKTEFEAMRKASEGVKEHNEQNHAVLFEKHDGHKREIIFDLSTKLDARFDEIMTKYDDAQIASQHKEKALGSKEQQQEEALNATKTAAEDLRLLVDALGSSLTDQCEKMSEDSKTVFNRVEEVGSKLDELIAGDMRAEHQTTREDISKAMVGLESIQAHVSEYDPKIFEGIKDILAIVGQHFEQTKMSTEEIKTSVQGIPGAIPLPAIASNPETSREVPSYEKYDDSAVHSKLDQLVSHATEAGKSVAEFVALEQIKEQVTATSNQLSDFISSQKETTYAASENKAKEAEEAAVALEKRVAQKSIVESDIVRLSGEREQLENEVHSLRQDKVELSALKARMSADLSSLETALDIRREELQVIEARAEGIERRILDGILDHSRSLLSTKSSRGPPNLDAMSRKRVVSTASNASNATKASSTNTAIPSATPSAVSSGVGMALKRRNNPAQRPLAANSAAGNKTGRRILSLSTLSSTNRNAGAAADRAVILAPSTTSAASKSGNPIRRSHSVKSNFPSRKSSWGGTKALGLYADTGEGDEDKENSILDEEDEEGAADELTDRGSEVGTERRTSYGTYTGESLSYGTGSVVSTDDADGRRTSYAPSTAGTIGARDFAIDEEDETAPPVIEGNYSEISTQGGNEHGGIAPPPPSSVAESEGGVSKQDAGEAGGLVLFGQDHGQEEKPDQGGAHSQINSDSGIGSEMPTAGLEVRRGSELFGR